MKNIQITKHFAQELINYLVKKPYGEVYKLIDYLVQQSEEEVGQEPRRPEKPSTPPAPEKSEKANKDV